MSIVCVCVGCAQACTQSVENCHVLSEVDRNKQINLIHTHTHLYLYLYLYLPLPELATWPPLRG